LLQLAVQLRQPVRLLAARCLDLADCLPALRYPQTTHCLELADCLPVLRYPQAAQLLPC
jgi:hypothetical protein